MGARRPRGAVGGRRLQRHLSDRCRRPGRVPVLGLAHQGDLRRGRRAARQGARGARAPAGAGEDRRLRHRGPARLPRPAGAFARRLARARPRPGEDAPARARRARRRLPARRPGDPGLHLGHDRQAQGGDAFARRHRLHDPRLQRDRRPGRERRADVLPAALPHRRAARRRVLRRLHRLGAELRREPRDRAGERARDRADGVHRGAADLGEVLFERGDRGARVGPAAAGRLRLGP